MSAQDLIDEAKRIRRKLRNPPNAVYDPGIDLTRKSTAHKGGEPVPDPPIKKILVEPQPLQPEAVAEPVQLVLQEIKIPIHFDDILETVSAYYQVSVEDLKSSNRRHRTCFARFVLVHLSLKLLAKAKRSLSWIARELDKDHTSIMHARNRIEAIIAGNTAVAAEVAMLENYIETNHNNRLAVPAIGQRGLAIQPWAGSQGQEIYGLGG